jgi:ribosomal protein S18 acetylase RimI-like enzyme
MMEIRPLSGIDPETIWNGFSKAFADYDVQINREQFMALIKRRGFDPDVSFAAFDGDDNIISFTLNGTGTFNGIPTAYDTGTGTVSEHRGKGLATKIFEHSLPFLEERNLQQYLLEVLQHNTGAVSVYRKLGFMVTREFNYFVQKSAEVKAEANPAGSTLSVRKIDPVAAAGMEGFADFAPSWQNSLESVRRVPDHFIALGAYEGDKIVGYCIIEPAGGDIPQFAVEKGIRRKGIGSLLFREAMHYNRSEIVKIVNADISCESLTAFLQSKNIPATGKQFEMIRKL